jgi:sarcosine oxidase gamma subunit
LAAKGGFGILVVLALVMAAGSAVAGQRLTVTGIVMDDYVLLDDNGETYAIAETVQGHALAEQSGSRVKVTGTVEEGENGKTIQVEAFTVIPE